MDENQTEEEIDILDIPDDEIDEYYSKLEESSNEEEVQQEEGSDEGTNEEEDVEASQTISEPLSDDEEGDSTDEDDTDDSTASEEATELDYKQEYDKLLAPFKANGKEMQVSSIEDARQLMQMGANYTKKMKALAPNLKIVKLLENNGLLDEGKISFLIDLSRKDPNAVTKFLKDSNIDPLDLDMDNAEKYQPKAYTVSDKELELDSVLDEIKDTESFKVTADVIGNKWDEPSKKVILDNPVLIKIINEHVQAGIYEKIQSVVERERMLGRLVGLSDIEAYKQVGDVIQAQGGFNNQTQAGAFTASNIKATNKVDPSVAKRKKAASSTKSNAATKSSNDFNPLDMSDEEFEKIMSSKYI